MHYSSELDIYEYVGIIMAFVIIFYINKHISILVLSVTVFKDTKLKTLIYNLAIAALLFKELHILKGCPTKQ